MTASSRTRESLLQEAVELERRALSERERAFQLHHDAAEIERSAQGHLARARELRTWAARTPSVRRF